MINWIDDKIGTGSFENVKKGVGYSIIDVRDMVDKAGNTEKIISEKINEAISVIDKGNKIVICCDFGISRSNGIAVGVCVVLYGMSLYDATAYVIERIGDKDIKPEVLTVVYKALKMKDSVFCPDINKNVLITGVSGVTGIRLCPFLKEECNVFTPSSKELNLLNNALSLDLFVKKNNISYIVHLANPRNSNKISSMGETLVMLKNILTVCETNNVHLLFISSSAVYSGYKTISLLASEELAMLPRGIYEETKYLCEKLIEAVGTQGNLKYTIVRASQVYGAGIYKPRFIFSFIEKAIKDDLISVHRYKNGLPCLDLIYADDYINILVEIIKSGKTGTYNIGTGTLTSTTDIAEQIINHIGSKSKIIEVIVETECGNIAMDYTKANKEFYWSPTVNIQAGLNKLITHELIGGNKK